jgi:hypothetical protein
VFVSSPVVYSERGRDRLTFMVEAELEEVRGAGLQPGQSVEIYLERDSR